MSLYTFVRWGRSRTRVKGIKWASSRGLLVASHRDWYRRDAVQHHTACDNASLAMVERCIISRLAHARNVPRHASSSTL